MRVQSGCRILLTNICFTSLEITFAELFRHLSEDDEHVDDEHVDDRRVAKVTIVDRGSSKGGGAEVDLTAPPSLCARSSVPSTLPSYYLMMTWWA